MICLFSSFSCLAADGLAPWDNVGISWLRVVQSRKDNVENRVVSDFMLFGNIVEHARLSGALRTISWSLEFRK